MKLIDADALLEAIKADRYTNAQDAIYFINNAPTVQRRLGEPDIWLTEKEYNTLKRAQKTERETVALYALKE